MDDGDFIDVATQWLEGRNAAYLAKEDSVVYYSSHTGRKSDYVWVKLSLPETVRTIQATKLNPKQVLSKTHVLIALQEMGKVYEFAVKHRFKTKPEIFNYIFEANQDMADIVMSAVVDELYARSYHAILYSQVLELYRLTLDKIEVVVHLRDMSALIHKWFPVQGYEVRTDKYRPQIKGQKKSALMMPHCKPRDVVEIPAQEIRDMAVKIYGALR